jgi:hypothetical protein
MKKTILVVLLVAMTMVCYAGGNSEGGGGGGGKNKNNGSISSQNGQISSAIYTASNPVQQYSFDALYGFVGQNGKTQSCQTCATFNIYAATTPGGLPQTAMNLSVLAGLQNGSIRADGSVGNFSLLSSTTAQNLGRNTYYDYTYTGMNNNFFVLSTSEFSTSNYTAGIVYNYNIRRDTTHFTAVIKINNIIQMIDSLNPNRPSASGYTTVNVRPLKEVPLGRNPR